MESKSNRLDEILGAMINSVNAAQDEANHFSKYLAVKYHQDPILTEFPVPNVVIDELEIDLKFVVEKVAEKNLSQEEVLLGAKALFPTFAANITEYALTVISDALNNKVQNLDIADDALAIQEIRKNIHSPEFENYIRQNILDGLEKGKDHILSPESILDVPIAVNSVIGVIAEKLVGHSELSSFLSSENSSQPEIEKIAAFLNTYFNNESKAFQVDHQKRLQKEIYVVCDVAELEKHSSQVISSIKVKFNLNNQEKDDQGMFHVEFPETR